MVGPAPVWVEGPPVEPRPYGLFTAAQMVDDPNARFLMGTVYEVDYCGEADDSAGVCWDFGTLAVAMNAARQATLDLAGQPDGGDYTIDWGDGTVEVDPTPDGATHTYATDGPRTIIVTGPRGYRAEAPITVTNGAATGGFAAAAAGLGKPSRTGVDTVDGEGFAVLHLFECNPMGRNDDFAERARRALMMGEQRAVERVFSQQLARDEDTVTLGGGTPMSVVDGLAALELYAGLNYPGRATVHATPDVVTLLDHGNVLMRGPISGQDTIQTVQGTKVVSGGGYSLREPTPVASGVVPANDAGMQWLYVTGAVQVRRAAVVEVNALDTSRNAYQALAERPYVVTWECITAAVQVAASEAGP